ncbi:SCO0607 family lipoprotein [Streptomyces sp. L7]
MSKRTRVAVLTAAPISAAGLLSACSFTTADAMCSSGEYPVLVPGSTRGRRLREERRHPAERLPRGYPKSKVPQHVDDKWDMYWQTHTVDTKGHITAAS